MLVGFAQTDITPPVGSLIPGGFRRGGSPGGPAPLPAPGAAPGAWAR
ncbi:MAG: hypothetical protein OXFUSZZB_000905, partial [Candidatus Fervidibacter sp.]